METMETGIIITIMETIGKMNVHGMHSCKDYWNYPKTNA